MIFAKIEDVARQQLGNLQGDQREVLTTNRGKGWEQSVVKDTHFGLGLRVECYVVLLELNKRRVKI
jgi:hypothetical protein